MKHDTSELTLRLVLGDQLNINHSWFSAIHSNVVYLMLEIRQETDYVRHHIQKVVAFFSSMRNFAAQLASQGHRVRYVTINDRENTHTLRSELVRALDDLRATRFEYLEPDEFRLDDQLRRISLELPVPVQCFSSEHFLTGRNELADFFEGKKTYVMEPFYRQVRKKYGYLMSGGQPLTGRWNYDAENRAHFTGGIPATSPYLPGNDVSEVVEHIQAAGVETFGNIDPLTFSWPQTREQGLEALHHFCEHLLHGFGKWQDVMSSADRTLYHSRLSFALNVKLIGPHEVITSVIDAWERNSSVIDIAQVEGFVRQIAGWREYIRGVYWAKMPEYASLNFFEHQRELPSWYWTGDTKMSCLRHAITQSLDDAYAHHIQRLMVTGNFALLAGIDPDQVDAWYLGIYIDAVEWVEMPNTRGMSQYADGGVVGTKPYVSSASYINKMSDYCSSCAYSPKERIGPKACPFNSLYWRFYAINRDRLSKNPRIGYAYPTLDKMGAGQVSELIQQAESYLENIESL